MPRATTKQGLLKSATEQYNKLWDVILSMTDEKQRAAFEFEDRDKNVRDVLVHLYEWHQLLINWVASNRGGEGKPFLPSPYNWKTYPQMNVELWEKHQNTPYESAIEMFKASHAKAMEVIASFSDEELFTKKYFSWTGSTTLGSYCVSATASHYDWALKKIKKHVKGRA